jgi:hypothetical protein
MVMFTSPKVPGERGYKALGAKRKALNIIVHLDGSWLRERVPQRKLTKRCGKPMKTNGFLVRF